MARQTAFTVAAAFGLVLAGCSGGTIGSNGVSLPNAGPDTAQTVSDAADALDVHRHSASDDARRAIGATDAFGSRVQELADENVGEVSAALSTGTPGRPGACRSGASFFAPDRAGDRNSTETLFFYDDGCARVARDIVRVYTPAGPGSELVRTRVLLYASESSARVAVRTDTSMLTEARFGNDGFPVVSAGFARTTSSRFSVGNGKQVVVGASEMVMVPTSTRVSDYCAESAGYSLRGVPSLDQTFGWQGAAVSGARAADGPQFVTWSASESGNELQAPIGSLSLVHGTPNRSCPISTPAFALTGSSMKGAFSFPLTAAFVRGRLANLRVSRATLPNGDRLTAATTSRHGQLAHVEGVITSGRIRIATFRIDPFGSGLLTITSTGAQYIVADWIVAGT